MAFTVTAAELVRLFRHVRALVIGDAMLDTYLEGTAARLCSEGPVPVVRKTTERRSPGGAANTAANLRALDAGVVFLGIVGRDSAGTLLRSTLREYGVDDSWLVEDEDTPAELIRTLRPHIHVKGGDYADEELPEAGAVQEVGGRIVILPLAGSMSTTSVIERIAHVAALTHEDSVGDMGARHGA